MGAKYTVECFKSKKWMKQRYYWHIKTNSNGKILLTSEMYRSGTFCEDIATRFSDDLNADFKCHY